MSGMPSALTPDSSTRASRSRFPPVCGANLANGTEHEERLPSESDAIDRRRRRLVPPIACAQAASRTTTIAAKSTWIRPVAAGLQRGSLLVWNVSHTGPDRQFE